MITSRTMGHITQLLHLISQFPTENPKPSLAAESNTDGEGTDLLKLLSQIRSRYRVLCGSLGVKPRLASGSATHGSSSKDANENSGSVWNIESDDSKKTKSPPLSY